MIWGISLENLKSRFLGLKTSKIGLKLDLGHLPRKLEKSIFGPKMAFYIEIYKLWEIEKIAKKGHFWPIRHGSNFFIFSTLALEKNSALILE